MAAAHKDRSGPRRNAALKDRQLNYRACTAAFARGLGLASPSALSGKSDFDVLPAPVATVYQAIEQQVLESAVPHVSSGRFSQSQPDDLLVVRSPVVSDSGDVTGIEISVLNIQELRSDYADVLARDQDHRQLFRRVPFGVSIYRGAETVFQNRCWERHFAQYQAQFDEWMSSAEEQGVSGDGNILLQRRQVAWQGEMLQAVFSFPRNGGKDVFIEKRKGARREKLPTESALLAAEAPDVESTLFKALKFPVLVCDNWLPVYRNEAAVQLLDEAGATDESLVGESGSIEGWFSDLEKADIEVMMRQRELVEFPLLSAINLAGRDYTVSVSPASWSGRSALLVTLQHNAQQQQQIEHATAQLEKFADFAAAAGDFHWEMDSEQRMTHLSVDLEPVLGVSNSQVLGVPLTRIIERYVDSEDMAQWSVLSVDMRNHQPFRDREFKWLHKSGGKRVVRLSGVPVFDQDRQFAGYRGIGSDFTEEHNSASAMAFHASHDSLTGLVNRREFEQRCDAAIVEARDKQVTHALCFMDLDNFKVVNDTCGHLAGDELLRQLSAMFSGLVRKSDVLARLGGDEFAVLVYDVGVNEVLRLANQLRSEVESFQFLWEGNRFTIGASIGVVIIDDRWEDRPALFGAADAACYEAKSLGRNRVLVYNETQIDSEAANIAPAWIDRITSAIKEKRVRLCMQKIQSLNEFNQPVTRVELLARIMEQSQPIVPGVFMPAADRYGLTINLDRAVIERAIDWLEGQPHVTESMQMCSINLHSRSFADEDFTVYLINALRAAKFDVSILCFEITETAAIANLSGVTQFMKRVGETGCKFALDDFGSGLSSFSYLKNLPISYLKIDGKYIRNILQEPVDFAMVKAINEIGQTLGKQTVAEYVESEEVLVKLRELGVDLAQGYQIGKPELIDF